MAVKGLRISRRNTVAGQNVFDTAEWSTYDIVTGSGKVLAGLEFPTFWSENAKQQVAEKYFRKADVPQFPDGILDMHQAARAGIGTTGLPRGGEHTLKQVINRLAGTVRFWGDYYGYFATEEDSQAFFDELAYHMIHQYGAFNSPQWFNTGQFWAYGILGDAKGQYYFDFEKMEAVPSTNAYEHPQAHACFILGVKDDLFGPKGIYDTAALEAKIFYFGSGTGSDYSTLRGKGEPVSGGGVSSGLLSYLRLFDVGGGTIKSGGKNRRAAKMDICKDTHPEVRDFIRWKMREEKKVRVLVEAGLDNHFEGEAYSTVSGMNSNNTVALSHDFFKALRDGETWQLRWVTDPNHVSDEFPAQEMLDDIGYCTWFSADPGIHANGTINDWNTCLNDEWIVASNPCSEYLWFDETACNLASHNLVKFYNFKENYFDVEHYRFAVDLWMIALDITVSMAQYPSKEFAEKSMQYRTTGLGYSNLGGLLMLMGYGYGTPEGLHIGGAVTALMGGQAYETSGRMAEALGQYPRFEANREHHLRVIRNHRRAAYNASHEEYEQLTIKPMGLADVKMPKEHTYLLEEARGAWDDALFMGIKYGYRNAQATVLAPTGTISFAMDCDTFGGEPDYALKKFKLLAGGGWLTAVNRLVPLALKRLGYTDEEIGDENTEGTIVHYVYQTGTIEKAPFVRAIHYSVFDTAVKAKHPNATRYLPPNAHIDMMAYQQPFISGAISKTVNLPEEATVQDIKDAYLYGYYSGLKAVAVYRENSKAVSVMYTDMNDKETGRKPLDLNAHEFDIREIFGGQFPALEEMVPEIATTSEVTEETAEAIEMPTYGCKDGACSV